MGGLILYFIIFYYILFTNAYHEIREEAKNYIWLITILYY